MRRAVARRVRFTQNSIRVYVNHMSLKAKIYTIMAAVFFILCFITGLIHILQPNKPLIIVCKDAKCQRAVSQLKSYINTKADPCEDFYAFACGNFHLRSHYMEAPLERMHNRIDITMRNMVTGKMNKSDESKLCRSAQKQRKYYKLCMDANKIDADEDHYFISAIDSIIKGLPLHSFRPENVTWHELIKRAFQRGTFYKFFLNVTSVYQQTDDKYLLRIEPVSSKYIARLRPLWSKENIAKVLAVIESHWAYPFDHLSEKIDALVKFSSQLFNVSSPSMNPPELSSWNLRMTTSVLDKETSMYFNANWKNFLKELTGVHLNQSDVILASFHDRSHFDNLMKILSPANIQLWQTYVIINMIYEDCQYLSNNIRNVCYQILHKAWPDDYPIKSRSDFCYDEALANFPNIAERELTVKMVPTEKRTKVERLVTDVMRTMFLSITDQHHVFDTFNRVTSFMNYASQLKILVGWHDVAYNEEEFEHFYGFGEAELPNNIIEARHQMNRAKAAGEFDNMVNPEKFNQLTKLGPFQISVDAYYDPANHSVVLLAPMLNPPIYDEDLPEYLNYGSLGAVIGSILINMLDESYLALRVNSYSDTADWMSKVVEVRSKDMKCVTEEYQKYDHKHPSLITPMPFQTILPNVFSHYQGILLAYEAYNFLEVTEKEQDLTALLGYTRSQLFWIISTIYQCNHLKYQMHSNINETYRPSSFQYPAVTGYKVNGPLMNSYDFTKDFNCPSNSPMNPKHKCIFSF